MNIHQDEKETKTMSPLPETEMQLLAKKKICYEVIRDKISQGIINGRISDLDRIVQLVVDFQYKKEMVTLGRTTLPAEEVAHCILQLQQHEVEYIINAMSKHPEEPISDDSLVAALYGIVGSWTALHGNAQMCQSRKSRRLLN